MGSDEVAGPEGKPPATWRPLILWTATILLFLGLAWFVGAVVVPAYQVHAAIENQHHTTIWINALDAAEELGGPDRAARKVSVYLRMPEWLTSRAHPIFSEMNNRAMAISLLEACRKPGVPPLTRELKNRDPAKRALAASALGYIGPDAIEAVPGLIELLTDEGPSDESWGHVPPPPVCSVAAEALGEIGPDAQTALPEIGRLLSHKDERVRRVAANAIAKIRPRPPE